MSEKFFDKIILVWKFTVRDCKMVKNKSDNPRKIGRRKAIKYGAAAVGTALCTPFISRAWATTTEINMLSWYGLAEPDMVEEFEAQNNVKFIQPSGLK